jgi:Domain of unknown function DUF29
MVKTVSQSADALMYEEDFYLWVGRQADLLRKGRFDDLDLAHLIEEVEDLGANLKAIAFSRTEQIIRHLLKLQYSSAAELRRLWRQSIRDERDQLELHLTTSLRNLIQSTLETRYARARRRATEDLNEHDERVEDLAQDCPYTLDQILSHDWFPANAHGVKD